MTSPSELPVATTVRWQPLRLGLVDLFYYDDEQFWFHDGRLLLRGNNGTGKSKVLALTLPLLLDGSLLPRRVEPDADPKKRMDWNLLLGGAHPSSERTGYAWVEFGRVEPDGTQVFTTLGLGLKAATGRGIVKHWFFLTDRRVGDLRLLDDTRTVLSQERLRAELETSGTGQVHSTREGYRRSVDERLFGLGEERYAALVDLLIQLRQPQLSKRPDEKLLSAALTEALPPLDQAVVADVAESFRSIEEEREGIAQAQDTLAAAQAFLAHYRGYAKVATRQHTTAVRLANSTYEHAGRELRETADRLARAAAEVEATVAAQASEEQRQSTLTGRQQALRESPEMRDAERLDQAETSATELEQRVDEAAHEAGRAQTRADDDARLRDAAEQRRDGASSELQRCASVAVECSEPAGLTTEHPAIRDDAGSAQQALTRRREQIGQVRRLVETAAGARTRAEQQRRVLDAAEADATGRAETLRTSEQSAAEAVAGHRNQVHAYLGSLTTLAVDADLDQLADQVEVWARDPTGTSPARAVVESAAATMLEQLSRLRAAAELEVSRLGGELNETRSRIAELEAGRDPEPPRTPGRDPAARTSATGAPLWRVTDFADAVTDGDRAGIEAALQSAGLIDAWLFADGTLEVDGDVVLGSAGAPVPDAHPDAHPGVALSSVLVPAVGPDTAVPPAAVAGVLSRIGLGESAAAPLWVEATGRWGSGPARGSWAKPRAEFIGAGAREATRRELLAALRDELARLDAEVATARSDVDSARQRAGLVTEEQNRYPTDGERRLSVVHTLVASALEEVTRARAAVDRARESSDATTAAAGQADDELTETAAELGTGTTAAQLDDTLDAVTAYAESLGDLRRAARGMSDTVSALDEATQRAAESAELLASRTDDVRDLRGRAATQRAHADALHRTVGASVAELQAELGEVASELADATTRLKLLAARLLEATASHAGLQQQERDLAARREEAAEARATVVAALRALAATGVPRVAEPDLTVPDPTAAEEWAMTSALGLARAAEQHLADVDESDAAWERSQQRLSSAHTELAGQMSRRGHTAVLEQHGPVLVAKVRYLGDEVDVDVLSGRLEADVAERERLLSARERETLENHLVNEVAGDLHDLLGSAQSQIDRMNRELADRRTSTGMQLRVVWRERTDGPAGLRGTRDLMLRSDATWTPEDRSTIGAFLQARIAEVREGDPTGGWQEHLDQALDYRHWHDFVVERRQHGQWRSASGPASGGERVLAASVPLFAAASSHYNSAGPLAPRLILLDEAFAGVDDDSRAKSLGLLATFDLDVVMTSEREWGCYPQVPGLAIAQLSRVEGVDAVGVTRWRWDGRHRERLEEVAGPARAGGAGPAGGLLSDGVEDTLL